MGAFMSTTQGWAAVDAAVMSTAGLPERERSVRIAAMTYPALRQMVSLKLHNLSDEMTLEVARMSTAKLESRIRQGRGCEFTSTEIALDDTDGSPELAIRILRADVNHFASKASREEVDALMRPLWPEILASSGAASIDDRDPAVQCRMGNLVVEALSKMPAKQSAPAIRSILRL